MGVLGVLALGLAAIGVYGVMSLIFSERTREIGVRLALGAKPSQLLAMIVRQATTFGAIGVAIGLLVALPTALLLRGQLYGIDSIDPATFLSRADGAAADLGARRAATGAQGDAHRSGRSAARLVHLFYFPALVVFFGQRQDILAR